MITPSQLDEEFEPYRNRFGFISDAFGNLDHNPLFHGFYVALKDRLGFLHASEVQRERNLLNPLIESPGLLRSAPVGEHNSNPHSHDNQRAMFWLSKRLALSYSKDFLELGRKNAWVFGDLKKSESYYERFTGMIAQAQISAGERPGCFRQTWLYGELWKSAEKPRSDIENVTLPYFMCKTIEGFNEFADATVKHWRARTLEKYPGGVGEVFDSWGGPWKNHPYVKHFWGVVS